VGGYGQFCHYLPRRRPDRCVMPADDCLDGLTEVSEKMPAIEDVDGVGCTPAHAVGIDVGAVTGDHFDAGVISQPRRDGVGLSVRQEVDDPIALQIDQDRAVAATAPPRPLIDAKHPGRYRSSLNRSRAADQPEERVSTGRHR
jgi:hypothetical protein